MARQAGTVVGVDIGSAAIKVVELSAAPGAQGSGGGTAEGVAASSAVRAAVSAPTPPEVIEEGRIKDPQAIGRALRELIQRAGIRGRRAVTAVNGQVALMREVRMPALPAEEVRQAARFEVERYLPYPIAEVTFDTVVIGESRDNGNSRLDVLIVAAQTDVLRQHMLAIQAAGLEPAVLEVEPLAVARAVSSRAAPERVTACIHLGAGVTMIVVAEGEVPRVIRTVAFGTTHVVQNAAARLGMTAEAADALRARLAAGGTADGISGLGDAVGDSLASLVTEVRRSFEYYGGQHRGMAPDHVVVTGGGAALPGVTQALTSALDMTVGIGDPFADLGEPPQPQLSGTGARYAVAAGLARRGVDER